VYKAYLIPGAGSSLKNPQSLSQSRKQWPPFLRSPKVHYSVYKNRHWILSWASPIQSNTSHYFSPRSVLKLSSLLLSLWKVKWSCPCA